jgi:hypothetical protein
MEEWARTAGRVELFIIKLYHILAHLLIYYFQWRAKILDTCPQVVGLKVNVLLPFQCVFIYFSFCRCQKYRKENCDFFLLLIY